MDISIAAYWLINIACVLAASSIVLAYLSQWYSALVGYGALVLGLVAAHMTIGSHIGSAIAFWAVVAALAVGISLMVPKQVSKSRKGLAFICTGALVGVLLGAVYSTNAAVIIGAVVGVLLGALAMGRLDVGRQLDFPSRQYCNYVLAKGLPVVVVFSMAMILVLLLKAVLNA